LRIWWPLNRLKLYSCCRLHMPTSIVLSTVSCQHWQKLRKCWKITRF